MFNSMHGVRVRDVLYVAAIVVAILVLVYSVTVLGSGRRVGAQSSGEPSVGAIHVQSPSSYYDTYERAWIIPEEDVSSSQYSAEFHNIVELNRSKEIVFSFIHSDIQCDDQNRIYRGGDSKNRKLYIGQANENIVVRGGENMGANCPTHTRHTVSVTISVAGKEINRSRADYCIASCSESVVALTTAPIVMPTAEVVVFTPEPPPPPPVPEPTRVWPTALPALESYPVFAPPPSCACDIVEVAAPNTPDFLNPDNYQVCEDGHCLTDNFPWASFHICGAESEDGYLIRWSGVAGDNAAFTVPDVNYLQVYERDMASDVIMIKSTVHPHTGQNVTVEYNRKSNELWFKAGDEVYVVNVNHDISTRR